MIQYKPVAYRQAAKHPIRRHEVGQITSQEARNLTVGGLLLDTAFSAGATWVGINTGVRTSGLLSILGWVVGIGGGLRTIVDLVGLASVATNGTPVVTTIPSALPVIE